MDTSGIFDEPDVLRRLGIEVEGKAFWISRVSLASYSPVFKAMLYGEFAEAKQNVITLPGKKAKDVEELLLCLIPHPHMKLIDDTNLQFLLAFADEYQIEDIVIRAEQFLIKKLSSRGQLGQALLDMLIIGSKYRMKEFLPVCVQRCAREFPFDRLKTLIPSLRVEVVASLAIAALASPVNSKCRFDCYAVFMHTCASCGSNTRSKFFKCAFCGWEYCGKCVDAGKPNDGKCTGDGSAAEVDIQQVLNRM